MKIHFIKKRNFWWEYPLFALQGLGSILDGLIMFFSMGFFVSSFAITVCRIRTEFFFKRMKK
jgi:hypothetical protein